MPLLSRLCRHGRLALLALGFLTRLGPSCPATAADLAACAIWFPPVGLVVGALALLPVFLGVGAHSPLLQGFFFTLLAVWLTRGLHLDGLADFADAWGALPEKDTFWRILKDSRIGAFGALSLILFLLGMVACAHTILIARRPVLLLFPFLWSRSAVLVFLALTPAAPASTLAAIFRQRAPKTGACVWLALCPLLQLIGAGAKSAFCCLAITLFWVFFLRREAARAGGMNGDFLGALICLVEAGTLIALALLAAQG